MACSLLKVGTMRKAYSILAVAVTTTACSGAVQPTPTSQQQQLAEELSFTSLADALANKEHFLPLCDANGYPLPGNINGKGGQTPSGGTTVEQFCDAIRQAPRPMPKPECPNDLNQTLSYTTLDDAIAQYMTFRPICDQDGYPLCGNLNGKVITTASTFCKALRDKNLQ